MSPTTRFLSLNAIKVDERLQMRVAINPEHVDDIAEALAAGTKLDGDPPVVYEDQLATYWLSDGFHRYAGHKKAGRTDMFCEIRQGSFRDALRHSLGANQHTCLKRTNADKRKAVETALSDQEIGMMSNRQIAELCGVSAPFVEGIRAELTVNGLQSTRRRGLDGRIIDTANIGKKAHSVPIPDVKAASVEPSRELTVNGLQSTTQKGRDGRTTGTADSVKAPMPADSLPEETPAPVTLSTPPAEPLRTDPFGRPLSGDLIRVFEDRTAILSMSAHLEDLKSRVKKLHDFPGGKHIALPLIDHHFCAAQKQLEAAAPEAVCPECGGSGDKRQAICKTCEGSGFVAARRFQGLAPVLQAKAKAFGK